MVAKPSFGAHKLKALLQVDCRALARHGFAALKPIVPSDRRADPSLPGLTRQSIHFARVFAIEVDPRVKPAGDVGKLSGRGRPYMPAHASSGSWGTDP